MQSSPSNPYPNKDPLTFTCLLLTSLLTLTLLIITFISSSTPTTPTPTHPPYPTLPSPLPPPPSLAYLLSGSSSDSSRLLRLLLSVYHPNNLYLLHLDLRADGAQRESLARSIRSVPALRAAGNVHVLGRADFAYRSGSSALSATLHAAAVLLRIGGARDWDWFVNLDADDYPLVTQDDLLHVFSFLPKDLNFVQHSSYIGWRESRTLKPIIVDPGLYYTSEAEMFHATQKRDLPNAFKIFTGFPSVVLSRKLIEHSILGTDNLPRILLMYYANTASSHKNYFQTLLCNSPEFNRTIVNHHLHYATWEDTPPRLEPRVLGLDDLKNMTESGAAFGTRFPRDDTEVLDRIDLEVLNRRPGNVVPGGWCLGGGSDDPCTVWGNADILRPGPGARNLARAVVQMLSSDSFRSNRCIWDASM